ncbi:hypothetical protein NLU13_5776 [Sarocladium strictum]|uniref:Uncharacterized protein n=1 Tax=Sarocladium strictum TaxID=5046 RepID=A0AA39GIC5_SARSR|nr:hypothetical protein NLU13_5776 [Sarocladium strictum]
MPRSKACGQQPNTASSSANVNPGLVTFEILQCRPKGPPPILPDIRAELEVLCNHQYRLNRIVGETFKAWWKEHGQKIPQDHLAKFPIELGRAVLDPTDQPRIAGHPLVKGRKPQDCTVSTIVILRCMFPEANVKRTLFAKEYMKRFVMVPWLPDCTWACSEFIKLWSCPLKGKGFQDAAVESQGSGKRRFGLRRNGTETTADGQKPKRVKREEHESTRLKETCLEQSKRPHGLPSPKSSSPAASKRSDSMPARKPRYRTKKIVRSIEKVTDRDKPPSDSCSSSTSSTDSSDDSASDSSGGNNRASGRGAKSQKDHKSAKGSKKKTPVAVDSTSESGSDSSSEYDSDPEECAKSPKGHKENACNNTQTSKDGDKDGHTSSSPGSSLADSGIPTVPLRRFSKETGVTAGSLPLEKTEEKPQVLPEPSGTRATPQESKKAISQAVVILQEAQRVRDEASELHRRTREMLEEVVAAKITAAECQHELKVLEDSVKTKLAEVDKRDEALDQWLVDNNKAIRKWSEGRFSKLQDVLKADIRAVRRDHNKLMVGSLRLWNTSVCEGIEQAMSKIKETIGWEQSHPRSEE